MTLIVAKIVFIICIIGFLFPYVLCLIDKIFKTAYSCRWGWHNGNGKTPSYHKNDILFVNLQSTCSKCGKEVMQDSQGNWF